jgi:hypothetical protein
MAKLAVDPKNFTKGAVKKIGSVREPLLIEGTLSCGGEKAAEFTRLHGPCLVQGTLNAQNAHFEQGLQVQGHAWLQDCKVNGQSGFAGQCSAKETSFKEQITTVQGSQIILEKCRAQDIRIEPAPWRWKWMAALSKWIGRARITVSDSSIHHVFTNGEAYGLIILKGQSKILGRVSKQVTVVDRRPKSVRVAEQKARPSAR